MGLSLKCPKPALQPLHRIPLTTPFLWQWSVTGASSQIKHNPHWVFLLDGAFSLVSHFSPLWLSDGLVFARARFLLRTNSGASMYHSLSLRGSNVSRMISLGILCKRISYRFVSGLYVKRVHSTRTLHVGVANQLIFLLEFRCGKGLFLLDGDFYNQHRQPWGMSTPY